MRKTCCCGLLAVGEYSKSTAGATLRPMPTLRPDASATTAPHPTPTVDPATVGTVRFGTAIGEGCALKGEASVFTRAVDVWWRADFVTARAATTDALVATMHDGRQVEFEYVAPDPSRGTWNVLCARKQTGAVSVGTFTVEVWDGHRATLLAAGTFERKP